MQAPPTQAQSLQFEFVLHESAHVGAVWFTPPEQSAAG
jgi:hypothetical protein